MMLSHLVRSPRASRHGLVATFATASAPSPPPLPQKTFSNQSKLEKLPIPPMQATLDKTLLTLKPLARSDEEWNSVNAAVQEYAQSGGIGEHLDKKLREYGSRQQNNWLEELWLHKAYLEYRESSVINVSYLCTFAFDPADYPKEMKTKAPPVGVYTKYQVERAAGWVSLLLDYKAMIDSETLPPEYADKAKKQPFCMDQYRKFFGATRVPSTPGDKVITPHPAMAQNIIVMVRDQIYTMDVLGPKGERVEIAEIEKALNACVSHCQSSPAQPSIARLSTNHRDAYYQSYSHLASLSPGNRRNLDVMEQALFVICLDDYNMGGEAELASRSRAILHGGPRCQNRWIDKEIQLVCSNDGRGGLMGEHTPADGASANGMVGWIVEQEPARDPANATDVILPPPRRLEWTVDDRVVSDIAASDEYIFDLINDVEMEYVMWKDTHGRWIKDAVKVSPDAFMQMMYQLAWARLYPLPTATYESASTRRFLHGRTETCRSTSIASEAFARSFDKKDVSDKERVELLRQACDSHVKYLKEASAGQGVDRYFLGVKCMLPESRFATTPPALFSDPVFARSSHFRLSTSNLSVSGKTVAGFGPVYMDGYGLNYNLQDSWMGSSVTARVQCPDTSAKKFAAALQESVAHVRKAVDAAAGKK